MAENIVINGTTYEGVETIKLKNDNGSDIEFEVKKSDEWQPNPTWWDIRTILENDTRDYTYKMIYLYISSTDVTTDLGLKGQAYATSDGAFYDYGSTVTPFTHTWDLSKDKPCYVDDLEAYKTRYVIVYSNKEITPPTKQFNVLWVHEKNKASLSSLGSRYMYYYSLQAATGLELGDVMSATYLFNECRGIKSIPKIDYSKVQLLNSCFSKTSISSVSELNMEKNRMWSRMFDGCSSLISVSGLNMSSATDSSYMFYECKGLQIALDLDTSKCTNTSYMFAYCNAVHTISKLDIGQSKNVSSMFSTCNNLTNLNLFNIKTSGLSIGSGTDWGHLLTKDSLINTIQQLWDYSSESTTYKLTMGTANTAKLSNVYVKLITATDEMIAKDPNINNKMPCEVCASTDEGAMLIMDYASSKGWTIS